MFMSLSDINFDMVDTKVGGCTVNDVSLKLGEKSLGLEGCT